MTIGNRLDQAMMAAKMKSQSDLARISGVPQATISRILKGVGSKGPETETVKKLAKACRVSFSWLNEGEGESGMVTASAQDTGMHEYPALDKRIVHAIKLMQQMPEYKLNQTIKIIDTIAEPLPDQNAGKAAADD